MFQFSLRIIRWCFALQSICINFITNDLWLEKHICLSIGWSMLMLWQNLYAKYNNNVHMQRSQLTVVRWSETTKNYVGPPEYSYPVVLWTTKISSPNQNCDMPQRYLNNCRHLRVIIPETLYPLSPFWQNKTRVRNHEGHELLTLRSIIIHAFCGFTKLLMWKHIASVKKITSVVTLVVVRTTKKL